MITDKCGYYESDILRLLKDYCNGHSVAIRLTSELRSTKFIDLNSESMAVIQDYFTLLQHGVDVT